MRLICALAVLSAAMVSPSPYAAAERGERIQAAAEAAEPFRIIGNIYYVGGQYGSYLITTPEGHILHDTGTAEMHALIVSNVEKLGFNPRDIRFMISSHAHWDHVEGHAAMKRVTGAQVVALGGDAVALQSGQDNSAIGARDFEPVTVDRVIEDGDTVTLGGMTLRALWTGGHTQGATMWMTTGPGRWRHLHRSLPRRRDSEPGGSALRQSPTPDGCRRHAEDPSKAEGARASRPLPA